MQLQREAAVFQRMCGIEFEGFFRSLGNNDERTTFDQAGGRCTKHLEDTAEGIDRFAMIERL